MRLLKEQGAFIERIKWEERAFIPTGETGLAVFERITASKPVIDLIEKNRGRSGGQIEPEPESEPEYGIPAMGEPKEEDKHMANEQDQHRVKYAVRALDPRTREEAELGEFDSSRRERPRPQEC
jgi:hypothetical protein